MKSFLIEENGVEKKAYNSMVVDHKSMAILNNKLSIRIVQELARKPGCALDIARSLKEHEQKIYYHLRKLEAAKFIKLLRSEKRYGMTAKIYDVVSPVVSTKLYEDGHTISDTPGLKNLQLKKFLHPFINDGKLDAKIVFGDPYPHGKFDIGAKSAVHMFDLAIYLGQCLNTTSYPHYILDIHLNPEDLKENLILIGNSMENAIFEKINEKMPVTFDDKHDGAIRSQFSNKTYNDPRNGFILKCKNPFNPAKSLLLFGGKRTRGLQGAMIAFLDHFGDILKKKPTASGVIVEGFDRDGDGKIDSVKILEVLS